ncbi:MAG: PEP/pyruvate-binding domain-containing protein, partial [Propionicimonas sp.]
DLTSADHEIAGGKGANLGELVHAGFPVPDGFVITTAAYTDFVARHKLAEAIAEAAAALIAGGSAELSAERVGELFAGAELPEPLTAQIRSAYAALGRQVPVAVRSSATAEDLAEASFAGQQDTYLNIVGDEALLAAVRDCWASLWTDRAIWYRAQHGVAPNTVALAVVVQRLVPAAASGVMFTANPANGRTEETVITAAWGLGEAVVSGAVDTDTVVVDTATGTVLSNVVADKAVRVDPVAGGTAEHPNPEESRRAGVLDEAAALRLAAIGSAIQAHFGAPQDIEWALAGGEFSIVQSRPITALPPPVGPVPTQWPMPTKGLYFRASIIEQLPDPLSPLFADLMATAVPSGLRRMLKEWISDAEMDVDFLTINGYAFYRYAYSAMGTMLLATPSAMRMLFAGSGRWLETRWQGLLAEYAAAVKAAGEPDPATMGAADLLAGVAGLVDEVAFYYTSVQTIIPLAATAELTWTGVYERLLKRLGDPSADTFLLGFDSDPILAEKALFDLAGWVREQPGLAAALCAPGATPLAAGTPSGVEPGSWQQWHERFGAHLAQFGHTLYNLDFINPVPADDPAPLLQALRFYLGPDAGDPHARQRRLAAEREAVTAALLARLPERRRRRVEPLLRWAQHLGPVREDALGAMGLAWPTTRRLLRELGGRLVAAGLLDEPMDVCWVPLAELRQLAEALDSAGPLPADLRTDVARRQQAFRGQRQASPPQYLPKNRLMDSMEWMYPAREGQSGSVITGTVGSGGVVTGRARVLAGPEDFAAFQPGEVLVASITTPAYTPLFAMASAVVTDIGGVLSHGSIVAREYGIPAVLGTGSATRRIHTGDEITVDGGAGRVVLPQVEASPVEVVRFSGIGWALAGLIGGLAVAAGAWLAYRRRR